VGDISLPTAWLDTMVAAGSGADVARYAMGVV
jgi:hypothetical protein